MRTTVSLDDDVLAAVERLRAERGLGLSEALNKIARAGMVRDAAPRTPYVPRSAALASRSTWPMSPRSSSFSMRPAHHTAAAEVADHSAQSPVACLAGCSADSDFARFAEVRWINPLA